MFKNIRTDKETVDNLKKIIENIPIILIFFYLVGFVYLKTFYSKFDIAIEYYLTVNDIVFIALYKITFVVLLYIIVELSEIFVSDFLRFLFKRFFLKHPNRDIDPSFVGGMILTIIISFVGFFHIPVKIFIFVLMPYLLYKKFSTANNLKLKKYQLLTAGLIVAAIVLAFISGKYEADTVKQGKDIQYLDLVINNKTYSIDGNKLSLIGETSSNLFIYDRKRKESVIYNKTDFQKIIIKDIDTVPSPRFEEGSLPIPRNSR